MRGRKKRKYRRRKSSRVRITGMKEREAFQASLDSLVQAAKAVGMKNATAAVDATRKLLETGGADPEYINCGPGFNGQEE